MMLSMLIVSEADEVEQVLGWPALELEPEVALILLNPVYKTRFFSGGVWLYIFVLCMLYIESLVVGEKGKFGGYAGDEMKNKNETKEPTRPKTRTQWAFCDNNRQQNYTATCLELITPDRAYAADVIC